MFDEFEARAFFTLLTYLSTIYVRERSIFLLLYQENFILKNYYFSVEIFNVLPTLI